MPRDQAESSGLKFSSVRLRLRLSLMPTERAPLRTSRSFETGRCAGPRLYCCRPIALRSRRRGRLGLSQRILPLITHPAHS